MVIGGKPKLESPLGVCSPLQPDEGWTLESGNLTAERFPFHAVFGMTDFGRISAFSSPALLSTTGDVFRQHLRVEKSSSLLLPTKSSRTSIRGAFFLTPLLKRAADIFDSLSFLLSCRKHLSRSWGNGTWRLFFSLQGAARLGEVGPKEGLIILPCTTIKSRMSRFLFLLVTSHFLSAMVLVWIPRPGAATPSPCTHIRMRKTHVQYMCITANDRWRTYSVHESCITSCARTLLFQNLLSLAIPENTSPSHQPRLPYYSSTLHSLSFF